MSSSKDIAAIYSKVNKGGWKQKQCNPSGRVDESFLSQLQHEKGSTTLCVEKGYPDKGRLLIFPKTYEIPVLGRVTIDDRESKPVQLLVGILSGPEGESRYRPTIEKAYSDLRQLIAEQ